MKKINITTLAQVLQKYVDFEKKLRKFWSAAFWIFHKADTSQINPIKERCN